MIGPIIHSEMISGKMHLRKTQRPPRKENSALLPFNIAHSIKKNQRELIHAQFFQRELPYAGHFSA